MNKKGEILVIDGSLGEGGGQIFRTALAYSAVKGAKIIIKNIRAKRKNPGLRPQHLAALKAIASITRATVKGDYIGSKEVYFEPKKILGGSYEIDIKTAGSVSLIIQAILPALLFSEERSIVRIKGGTDVPMAPPIDSFRYVFFPFLRSIGLKVELEVVRRGHYPRGGGEVILTVEPADEIPSIFLVNRGEVTGIKGRSHCVRLPKHVALRQADAAKRYLFNRGYRDIQIDVETYDRNKDPHLGPGSGIVLWAETENPSLISADSLGARGKPAEAVGEQAAKSLINQLERGGAVDVHHTDQLIPFMALAVGESKIYSSEISLHTLTAIKIAELVLDRKFKVEGKLGEPGYITTLNSYK